MPTVVAMMLGQLDLRPGDRVLEIGAGTGYNAALLAELVRRDRQRHHHRHPPRRHRPCPLRPRLDRLRAGLLLVPSIFCRQAPVSFACPDLEPVLVYPVNPADDWLQQVALEDGTDRHLPLLIGQTRSRVLSALQASRTTSDLAKRCQLSIASASEHASVLRGAGLVTTERCGRAVRHSLTPMGRALLAGYL